MLEMIHSPSDVKRLNTDQTRQLCDELRTFFGAACGRKRRAFGV